MPLTQAVPGLSPVTVSGAPAGNISTNPAVGASARGSWAATAEVLAKMGRSGARLPHNVQGRLIYNLMRPRMSFHLAWWLGGAPYPPPPCGSPHPQTVNLTASSANAPYGNATYACEWQWGACRCRCGESDSITSVKQEHRPTSWPPSPALISPRRDGQLHQRRIRQLLHGCSVVPGWPGRT